MDKDLNSKKQQSPRNVFAIFIFTGSIVIYSLAYSEFSVLIRAGIIFLLMILYIYWAAPKKKNNNDLYNVAYANSCYYLGFIYTLISLMISTILFDSKNDISLILGNFGISLSSTILGFSFRAWWIHFSAKKNILESTTEKSLEEEVLHYLPELLDELRKINANQYKDIINNLNNKFTELNDIISTNIKFFQSKNNNKEQELLLKNNIKKLEELNNKFKEIITTISNTKENIDAFSTSINDTSTKLKNNEEIVDICYGKLAKNIQLQEETYLKAHTETIDNIKKFNELIINLHTKQTNIFSDTLTNINEFKNHVVTADSTTKNFINNIISFKESTKTLEDFLNDSIKEFDKNVNKMKLITENIYNDSFKKFEESSQKIKSTAEKLELIVNNINKNKFHLFIDKIISFFEKNKK